MRDRELLRRSHGLRTYRTGNNHRSYLSSADQGTSLHCSDR